jgi:putative FmdB family regulatory protein
MPTYEYACTDCGQHVEVFQSVSDEPLEACGVCGGRLRKVFHPAGLLFKGSGFYTTDSRKKEPAGKSDSSKPAESKPAKKDDKKKASPGKKEGASGGRPKPKEKSA